MAVTFQRTGVKSFTVTDDGPTASWIEVVADYSVDPPSIVATLPYIDHPGETWEQVDAMLTAQFGA